MREIKFRAWEKLHKRMWIVEKLHFQTPDYIQVTINHPVSGFTSFNPKEIELMQFTGLKDKDGREIYEGDIVQCACGKPDCVKRHVIEWDDAAFLKQTGAEKTMIVIGNIYENNLFANHATLRG